jgi:hypothetical protein
MSSWRKRTRSAAKPDLERPLHNKRRKIANGFRRREEANAVPTAQSALLLHGIRQPYSITTGYEIPTLQDDTELLVKVEAVGLNPIDWKAP